MAHIQDILEDLVSYTVPLQIEMIRVTGTDSKTLLEANDDPNNCRITMKATTKEVYPEFEGRFGMPNLPIIKGYLDIFKHTAVDEAADKSTIEVLRKADGTPTDIELTVPDVITQTYRLMRDNLPKQLTTKEGALKWDTEIKQPARSKVDQFGKAAGVLAGVEKNFAIKSDGEKLKFCIGDEDGSTSKTIYVFADGVKNKINPPVLWECSKFLNIMNLAANAKTLIKISNQGVIQINVDSGLIDYEFMLPGFKA